MLEPLGQTRAVLGGEPSSGEVEWCRTYSGFGDGQSSSCGASSIMTSSTTHRQTDERTVTGSGVHVQIRTRRSTTMTTEQLVRTP